MIELEYLKSILHYDLDTGIWTWIKARQRIKAGSVAGNVDFWGYIRIKIDQKIYKAHRLAFFYMTGAWPEKEVDHEDLNRQNNKWKNLRNVTGNQNQANKFKLVNNTSGIKGVVWDKDRSMWRAQITTNNKVINLGRYITKEEAALAYEAAAIKYHGEFARTDN